MSRTAVVLLTALVAAGCSGSDSGSGDAVATTLPDATPVETTVAETTAAPTTEAPATTSTDAPTTTVDDEAALVAEVEQAYFDAFDAYHEAIFDPANEELRAALAEHYTGVGLENVLDILDDLVELNAVARENPDFGPARTEITGPVRFTNDERTEASLVVCELNAEWFVEPGAGPNGEDSVMRTDVIRSDLTVLLRVGGGIWKQERGGGGGVQIGVETCD